ncbi:MAG: Mrp/NBP35 family ATP-binding protein [Chloroflexaceae bacterium]|jgi:ATP-binding protein involved in chromosome partitioning|nr:Mrp/NBP35 family ATP-binding protein [Chloroflexaceae bacterium]
MPDRIPNISTLIAVASGKGGVGKTTATVHLALALAAQGKRVGIFDADIYGPNVPLMLGVHRRAKASGMVTVARVGNQPYIPPLERFGLKIMSLGLLVGEEDTLLPDSNQAGRIVIRTLRDVLWGELDYLLLDLPPGSGEPQISLVQQIALDGAVVVTTPQDMSLLDAGRSLGLFRQHHIPIIGIVENMSYAVCPHCGERIEVFAQSERPWLVQQEGLELLGRVPMDIGVSRPLAGPQPAPVFQAIAARVAEKAHSRD